jgi:autotransporter-associated beta strand protein
MGFRSVVAADAGSAGTTVGEVRQRHRPVAGLGSRRRAAWLLTTSIVGAFLLTIPLGARAADLDLQGNSQTLPQAGHFGDLGYLNGTDNLTNSVNTGAIALLTEGHNLGTTVDYNGTISDGAGQTGIRHLSGSTVFHGINSYSGGTNIVTGRLTGSNGAAFGTGLIRVENGATVALQASGSTTLNNDIWITGTGDTASGAVFNTQGNNTIAGTVRLLGDARIGGNDRLAIANVESSAGATLTTGGDGVVAIGNIDLVAGGVVVDAAPTGGLDITGTGAYTGETRVKGGTLRLLNGAAIADTGAVVIESAGALQVINSETIGSLAGAGAVQISAGQTLTTGDTTSTTVSGIISGATGALAKTGTGTLTLTGANTYGGGTTLSAGRIAIGANTALGTGALALAGGTLQTTANMSFANTINVSGAGSSIDTGANTLTLTGALGGANSFSKTGTGTLVFGSTLDTSGHSNGMTLAGGTLSLQGSLSAGFGTITTTGSVIDYASGVTNAAALNLNSNTTQVQVLTGTATQSGGISETGGARPLEKIGAGTFVLTSNVIYTGDTTISAGTLQIGDGGVSGSILGNIINNATLVFNRSNPAFYSSIISGTGAVIMSGADTLLLSGANTYTGGTTVSAGTLRAGAVDVFGIGSAMTVSGGTLNLSGFNQSLGSLAGSASTTVSLGSATLTAGSNNTSTAYNGIITGTGDLIKAGTGTLTLAGANTYSGGTTLSAGRIAIGANTALGTGALALAGGTLQTTANMSFANTINVTGAGSSIDTGATTLTLTGALGGGNSFSKTGSGTLVFGSTLDTSGHSNGMTLAGGTLSLQGSLAAGFGTITTTGSVIDYASGITSAAAIDVNSSTTQLQVLTGTATQSGVISETGGARPLEKIGAGTLVLSGANSYSGGTTISAGVLNMRSDTALGSGAVTVASGAALELQGGINPDNALTLNGSGIANGGALRNISSTTQYDGNVTLGSATRINADAGTLYMRSVTGTNTDLSVGGGGRVRIDGNLSLGTGNLVMDGVGGLLALAGANSFAGLTISAGEVQLWNGDAVANTSAVTVAAAGTLGVVNSETIGSLTGSGRVEIANGRELRTGANNTSTTFSGVISDSNFASLGGLFKLGTGTFTLSGINTYTGPTTVDAGTLSVNGSIASSSLTTVNASGTLAGNGTLGNTTINGGTLAPGNSIGLLTVQGNLVFTSASRYMVEVSPGNADRVDVTGTATLGGAAVNASFAPGAYVAKQYTIVNAAGGVIGTFGSQVNTNLPSTFRSGLSYDASNAYLDLTLNFTPETPPDTPLGQPAPVYQPLNANQREVGNALVGYFNRVGGIPLVFGALNAAGLTQVSGEAATGSQQATFDAMTQFMGLLTDPAIDGRGSNGSAAATPFADETMRYAAQRRPSDALAAIDRKAPPMAPVFQERWNMWAAGFGGSRNTDGSTVAGSNDTRSSLAAVAVGADYWLSPNTVAGFSLAGGGTSFSVAGGGSGRSDLFQAGAFVRHTAGSAYLTAAAAYGWQDVTTDRTVSVAGIDRLHANFSANAYSGRIEGGNRFVTPWLGGFALTPYAAAQVTAFDLPSYAETSAGGATTFALAYSGKTVTATRSEFGFRTDRSFAVNDALLTLRGRAAWAHDYTTDRSASATFQSLPGASFVVNGAAQARDAALTTASAELKWTNGWAVAATFEGEFSQVTRSYAGKGAVRYAW